MEVVPGVKAGPGGGGAAGLPRFHLSYTPPSGVLIADWAAPPDSAVATNIGDFFTYAGAPSGSGDLTTASDALVTATIKVLWASTVPGDFLVWSIWDASPAEDWQEVEGLSLIGGSGTTGFLTVTYPPHFVPAGTGLVQRENYTNSDTGLITGFDYWAQVVTL